MKINFLISISTFFIISLNTTAQDIIEIPLTQKDGYGYFPYSLGGISPYREMKNNPWEKTQLKVFGVPENWTETKIGDIETNVYQSTYQNHLQGNISDSIYLEFQKMMDWKPNPSELSKEQLRTKIAFAYGKDSTGKLKMIVDVNNNLDFSDDESFVPHVRTRGKKLDRDSVALNNLITVSYEKLVNNKITLVSAPLFIAHISQINIFTCNFAQYSIADFKGEKIGVCSDGFGNLSYGNPTLAILNDSLKEGDKISREQQIAKNEYIEIQGKLYENLGVNINKNVLKLKKVASPKNELNSTQIGFQSFSFEGDDFMTMSHISSEELKGKYVLLDFWAVWCAPCIKEIPHLKSLYEKTEREDFEIISIVGESTPKQLKEMIEKKSISWPQILSTDSNQIKETFNVNGYPTTFLLNPDGVIVAKRLRGKKLEEKVLELISEKQKKDDKH